MSELPLSLSIETISEVLGVTPRRIQQLAEIGIVERDLNGRYKTSSIAAYIEYVKTENRSKPKEIGEKDREQARLYSAQADEKELKVRILRGELISIEQFRFITTNMIRAVRTKLLALPNNMARSLVGIEKVTEAMDILQKAVYEALTDLAEDENLIPEIPGADDDLESLEGSASDVCTAPEVDSDRMGG